MKGQFYISNAIGKINRYSYQTVCQNRSQTVQQTP